MCKPFGTIFKPTSIVNSLNPTIHSAFNIIFHYLFPQLTMGLAALILLFKSMTLWKGTAAYQPTGMLT